jgi:hypothetical protein
MLHQILHRGFVSALRHPGLILLDIFWKAVWLVVTILLSGLLFFWIGTHVRSFLLEGWNPSNVLPAIAFVREFHAAFGSYIFWGLWILGAISAILWLLLEAYFRSGILPAPDGSFAENASAHFTVFLVSGVVRTLILLSAGLLIAVVCLWPFLGSSGRDWQEMFGEARGVAIIGAAILMTLVFLLTIGDTLIRSNAVNLLGTHMLEIAGLIGMLLLFEACIAASAGIAVIVGVLYVSSAVGVIAAAAGAFLALLFVSTAHSYLLLVRYFSIGIMKQDVTEV